MHPPERHFPFDATRLEILAFRSGLDDGELRDWLRDRIGAATRATTTEQVEVDEMAWATSQPPEVRAAVEAFLAQF